ncbi:AMP-binding protein [Micromonospora sp. CPCC 205546]|uniref:AMP-binding protein n=1 Tax=Micromonospora sp. CPCC 205546 TaxID=3122397 RepID=UPI002FF0455C
MFPDPRWNDTARPYPYGESVHGIFAAVVDRQPEAVALIDGDTAISYRTLDRASDWYAVRLAAEGVCRGDLVPVRLPRSAELVACMLAVLKLGAAYTLVDESWPSSRVAEVLAQTGAGVVVGIADDTAVDRKVTAWFPPTGGLATVAGQETGFRAVEVDGSDPCCVFFTSGTTGQPKGALTPHRATARLFRPDGFMDLGPGTVLPQAAAVPWDGYSLEVWSVLLTGGTSVVVREPYLTPQLLCELVGRYGVNAVFLTSSLFTLAVDEGLDAFDGVRQVVTGGEVLSVPHAARFLERHPETALVNIYGPVEGTVCATAHRVRRVDCDRPGGVPIGGPVADTQVYVVDGDRLCAVGEPGEVCIAGAGLALGYLEPQGPAGERFTLLPVPGGPVRVYRTGDLASWDDEGLLHFHGRADRQVKIRGNRVEPAEVERQIEAALPGVRRCTLLPVRDERGGVRGLAAFCVPTRSGDPLVGAMDILRSSLVAYHVPQSLVSIDRIPLTPTGKLDERALLARLATPAVAEGGPGRSRPSAAVSLTEEIAEVFAEVLERADVPVDVAFPALGGTSLGAGRICARLGARLGVPVPVSVFLAHPSVAELTVWLSRHRDLGAVEPVGHGEPAQDGGVPLTATQEGFLTRQLLDPADRSAYCLTAWELPVGLDVAALASAVVDVHHRHFALRSRYVSERGRGRLLPGPSPAPRLEVLAAKPDLPAALAAVRAELAGPLDLPAGQIWRTVLVPASPHVTVLGYVVHHIAFDGWSESVIAADLERAYRARTAGTAPNWQPVPTPAQVRSIRDRHLRMVDLEQQYARLRTTLSGIPELALPPATASGPAAVRRVEVALTATEVRGVQDLAARSGSTLFTALLTCYGAALADLTGQHDIGVGVPMVQRMDPVLEHSVGCHVGMVCVRMRGAALGRGPAAARSTAEAVRTAFGCQDVGFADAVRLVNPARTARSPLFQNIFVLQDNARAEFRPQDVPATHHRLPYLGIPAEIQTEVWPVGDGGLKVVVNTQTTAVTEDLTHQLAATLAERIRHAAEY